MFSLHKKGKLFECFIDTLDGCQSVDQSRETITDADALEIKLTSFETVLTAHVFNKIFSITAPASLYLQSGKFDLLTAIRSTETAESQLEKLNLFSQSSCPCKIVLCGPRTRTRFCFEAHKMNRNDFLASYPTTKSRKIQSVDIGRKRSFMPLTQQSCQLEIASHRTKLS